jgi:hypothetical protein
MIGCVTHVVDASQKGLIGGADTTLNIERYHLIYLLKILKWLSPALAYIVANPRSP